MAPGSAADVATSEEECPMPWQDEHLLPHLLPLRLLGLRLLQD